MCKVAIIIPTYNVKEYFEECIESVLSQKTEYSYKIYIADDHSTDGTLDIINKYKEMYNDKIEVIYSSENQGILKNTNRVLKMIDSDYFSYLDGDDYWIDDQKIQKQVSFLEKNKDFSMHSGNTYYLVDGKLSSKIIKEKKTNKTYSFQNQLDDSIPFFHTSSIMYRNVVFKNKVPDIFFDVEDTFENCAVRGEDFRRILHLELGNVYISDECFSVYRIRGNSVWQGSSDIKRLIERAIINNFHAKYFKDKYGNYFYEKAKMNYAYLIIRLFAKYKLFSYCCLEDKELDLLNCLLKDINKNKGIYDRSLLLCLSNKIKMMLKY